MANVKGSSLWKLARFLVKWSPGQSLGGRVLDGRRRLGKSAWSKIWKYVVYPRPALRIDCHGDHLWRTVDRSLPRLTGAFLRAWLHGAFWGCAPAPLTKLDLIDWLIDWYWTRATCVSDFNGAIKRKCRNWQNYSAVPATFIYSSRHYRGIADVCFELHFRVTPGQFRSAAVG